MKDEISKIILEELRSLRSDIVPRVSKIEAWQNNADGKITMFGLFCTAIGAAIVWITSIFKH